MSWYRNRELTNIFRNDLQGLPALDNNGKSIMVFPVTESLETMTSAITLGKNVPRGFRQKLSEGHFILFDQDNSLDIVDVNENIPVTFLIPVNDGTERRITTQDMTDAALELLCITVDEKIDNYCNFIENIANFISVVEKAQNAIQENLHATSNDIARADYFFTELSAGRNGLLSNYEIGRLKEERDLRKRIRTLDINHQDAETVPTCAEIKDLRATYKRLCDKVRIEEQPDSPESEPGP